MKINKDSAAIVIWLKECANRARQGNLEALKACYEVMLYAGFTPKEIIEKSSEAEISYIEIMTWVFEFMLQDMKGLKND